MPGARFEQVVDSSTILMAQDGEFRSFRDWEEVPAAASPAADHDWPAAASASRELQEFRGV